jgi:hypothetical protein
LITVLTVFRHSASWRWRIVAPPALYGKYEFDSRVSISERGASLPASAIVTMKA